MTSTTTMTPSLTTSPTSPTRHPDVRWAALTIVMLATAGAIGCEPPPTRAPIARPDERAPVDVDVDDAFLAADIDVAVIPIRVDSERGIVTLLNRGRADRAARFSLRAASGARADVPAIEGLRTVDVALQLDASDTLSLYDGEHEIMRLPYTLAAGAVLVPEDASPRGLLAASSYVARARALEPVPVIARVANPSATNVALTCDPQQPFAPVAVAADGTVELDVDVDGDGDGELCFVRVSAPGKVPLVRGFLGKIGVTDLGLLEGRARDELRGERISRTRVSFGRGITLEADAFDLDAAGALTLSFLRDVDGLSLDLEPAALAGGVLIDNERGDAHIEFKNRPALLTLAGAGDATLRDGERAVVALRDVDLAAAPADALRHDGWLSLYSDRAELVVDRFSPVVIDRGWERVILEELLSEPLTLEVGGSCLCAGKGEGSCTFEPYSITESSSLSIDMSTGSSSELGAAAGLSGDVADGVEGEGSLEAGLAKSVETSLGQERSVELGRGCTVDTPARMLCHDQRAVATITTKQVKMRVERYSWGVYLLPFVREINQPLPEETSLAEGVGVIYVSTVTTASTLTFLGVAWRWVLVAEGTLTYPLGCGTVSYPTTADFDGCGCRGDETPATVDGVSLAVGYRTDGTAPRPLVCAGTGDLVIPRAQFVAQSSGAPTCAATTPILERLAREALAGISAETCDQACEQRGCSIGLLQSEPPPDALMTCTDTGPTLALAAVASAGCVCDNDLDGDETRDLLDLNLDGDELLDAVDDDDDGDGTADGDDAFPRDPREQRDTDADTIGDNADGDDDQDGVPDTVDALPLDANEQADLDGDGIGDNADTDVDGDLLDNVFDLFPRDKGLFGDRDQDLVDDKNDNCPSLPNPDQLDADGDGKGDACDGQDTCDPTDEDACDDQQGCLLRDDETRPVFACGFDFDTFTDETLVLGAGSVAFETADACFLALETHDVEVFALAETSARLELTALARDLCPAGLAGVALHDDGSQDAALVTDVGCVEAGGGAAALTVVVGGVAVCAQDDAS